MTWTDQYGAARTTLPHARKSCGHFDGSADEHVAIEEEADAANHLLLFDILAPGQLLPDATGQGFAEGHR